METIQIKEDAILQLPSRDLDLIIKFPKRDDNIILQVRLEGPSLDIVLDKPKMVAVWQDENMAPAKALNRLNPHIRIGDQIMIPLHRDMFE